MFEYIIIYGAAMIVNLHFVFYLDLRMKIVSELVLCERSIDLDFWRKYSNIWIEIMYQKSKQLGLHVLLLPCNRCMFFSINCVNIIYSSDVCCTLIYMTAIWLKITEDMFYYWTSKFALLIGNILVKICPSQAFWKQLLLILQVSSNALFQSGMTRRILMFVIYSYQALGCVRSQMPEFFHFLIKKRLPGTILHLSVTKFSTDCFKSVYKKYVSSSVWDSVPG
jgi:hypothetical protein